MYKVGFWEFEITPPLGCGIPGYGDLRFGTGVKDKLFTKSVVVEEDNEVFVMVAVDNCGFAKPVYDKIIDRIVSKVPVDKKNVLVCSTHTHTGGPSHGSSQSNNDVELDAAYLDNLIKMSADGACLAYEKRENANVYYACGEVKGISFVRNYVMKDGTIRTNPGRLNPDIVRPFSEPDYSLPVLFVENEQGKLMGVLYDFACHQDCVDGTEYTGDYSSIVSKILKEKFGSDFTSVYFCGTAGNINHFNVKTAGDKPDHYVMMAERLAEEIQKIYSDKELVTGPIKADKVSYSVKRRLPSDAEMQECYRIVKETKVPEGIKIAADSPKELFDFMMARRKIEMVENSPKDFPVVVQVAKIGNVNIFGLQGEIFAQFADKIRESVKGDKNMFLTVANSDWMYVPVPELYGTLIYEGAYGSAMMNENDVVEMIDKAIEMSNNL